MTLTTTDITKFSQIIKSIVRKEIGRENKNLNDSLTTQIKLSKTSIENSVNNLEDRIKNLEIGKNIDSKNIVIIQKDVHKLATLLAKTTNFLDRDNVNTLNRVKKIEEYLNFN